MPLSPKSNRVVTKLKINSQFHIEILLYLSNSINQQTLGFRIQKLENQSISKPKKSTTSKQRHHNDLIRTRKKPNPSNYTSINSLHEKENRTIVSKGNSNKIRNKHQSNDHQEPKKHDISHTIVR